MGEAIPDAQNGSPCTVTECDQYQDFKFSSNILCFKYLCEAISDAKMSSATLQKGAPPENVAMSDAQSGPCTATYLLEIPDLQLLIFAGHQKTKKEEKKGAKGQKVIGSLPADVAPPPINMTKEPNITDCLSNHQSEEREIENVTPIKASYR